MDCSTTRLGLTSSFLLTSLCSFQGALKILANLQNDTAIFDSASQRLWPFGLFFLTLVSKRFDLEVEQLTLLASLALVSVLSP